MNIDFEVVLGLLLILLAAAIALNGLNLLKIAPKGRRSAIHAQAKSIKAIVSGTINSNRQFPKSDEVVNGMGYKLDKKTGKVLATPKGTFSYHALLNMIYK